MAHFNDALIPGILHRERDLSGGKMISATEWRSSEKSQSLKSADDWLAKDRSAAVVCVRGHVLDLLNHTSF